MFSSLPISSSVFVRLFRLWSAARSCGEPPLPAMQDKLALFGPPPELAVASASLFELIEAHLERPLRPECCCSRDLSRDERALLGVLAHAPAPGQPLASRAIPHGLPGAICWAAFAVRRGLAAGFGEDRAVSAEIAPAACPFSPSPPLSAASAHLVAAGGTN